MLWKNRGRAEYCTLGLLLAGYRSMAADEFRNRIEDMPGAAGT
jgi:hypothetical protein